MINNKPSWYMTETEREKAEYDFWKEGLDFLVAEGEDITEHLQERPACPYPEVTA